MKTLKIISTALIVVFSLSAFANERKANRKMKKAKKMTSMVISAPEMVWGTPFDFNTSNIEQLKTSRYLLFAAPEMIWGNPEELNFKALEKLKNIPLVANPEMVWGNSNDVHYFEIGK